MKKTDIVVLILSTIFSAIISEASAQNLIISGSIAEMYDDNTNATSDDQKSDYITNLMLELGVNLEGKTQNLQLLGHIYQQLYYKQSNLNNNSQDLILNYTKEFSSRDRFSLNNNFHHYPEPRDFQYMFGQPEGRNGYYTNSLILAFDKDLMSDLSINIHYINIATRALTEETNDSMSNGAGSILNYSVNAFNIISLLYDFNITQYEAGRGNDQGDIIQHTAGLGYQHYFTRQLSVSGRGGVEYVKSQGDVHYNPFFILSIINVIDQNNTINVSISRRYQTTLLTNEVYKIWNFSALFTRQISSRLSFSFSGFYQYGETVSTVTNSESRLLGITTFMDYNLSEHIFLNVRYAYTKNENRQTKPESFKEEYDRNQIQVAVSAQY